MKISKFNLEAFATPTNISYYWAGFLAADGTIGINTKKYKNKIYKTLRLRIIGTPELLNWISKFFGKTCKPIIHCDSKIHIISISDNKLLSDLVNFSERYKLPILKRKWDKVRNFNGN